MPVGLQFRATPGSIVNRSRAVNETGDPVGLSVERGNSIALLGGDINFEGSNLTAIEGRIELGGILEDGTISIDIDADSETSTKLFFNYPSKINRSDLVIRDQGNVQILSSEIPDLNLNQLEMTRNKPTFRTLNCHARAVKSKS
jgi:hypothetical protein